MGERIQKYLRNGTLLVLGLSVFVLNPGWAGSDQIKTRMIAENTQVRLKPNIDSMIIRMVPVGAVFVSEREVGDWYQVSFSPDLDGTVIVGYIHSGSVERLSDAPFEQKKRIQIFPDAVKRSQRSSRNGFGISFKLSGGWGYSDMRDWNTEITEKMELIRFGSSLIDGELIEIHYGPDLSGEVIVQILQGFGIGLGVGFMETNNGKGKAKVTLSTPPAGSSFLDIIDQSKAKALSFKMGLYYFFPKNSKFRIFLNAGAGYYLTHLSNDYLRLGLYEGDYWQQTKFNTSSNGIGYHGGLGFELDLSQNFAFFIEGMGRYAKFSGYSGEKTYESLTTSLPNSSEGTLYFYEQETTNGWRDAVSVWTYPPEGSSQRNAREAVINFSGVALRAGFRIKLF